ncbi:MAG: hypothetical protein AAF702_29150 [Chloroflexota bacterium]
MKVQLNRQRLVRGAVIATLATAIIMARPIQPAFAQSNDNDQVIINEQHGLGETFRAERFIDSMDTSGGYIGEDQLIANALGLNEEELEEAYSKAFDLALEQAVSDGKLTQAQADELKENNHGLYMLEGFASDDEMEQYLAQALDLSQEEFDAAMDSAIQKAADDGLITQAQANDMLLEKLIEEKLEEAYGQALDEGVRRDLITQSQADTMREESWGGLGDEEEVFMMDLCGPMGDFGRFDFHFGPGGTEEELFHFFGSEGFNFDLDEEFDRFGFLEELHDFGGRWFHSPESNPFR